MNILYAIAASVAIISAPHFLPKVASAVSDFSVSGYVCGASEEEIDKAIGKHLGGADEYMREQAREHISAVVNSGDCESMVKESAMDLGRGF